MYTNLVQETRSKIKKHGYDTEDVLWVGSLDGAYKVSWNKFASDNSDFEYDNGYGSHEVPSDLVIVGDGWWLQRHEYDGAELWMFMTQPKVKDDSVEFGPMKNKWDMYPDIGECVEESD